MGIKIDEGDRMNIGVILFSVGLIIVLIVSDKF